MVLDIIDIFIDALTGFVGAVADAMLLAFDTLVYDPTTGLTGIAVWSLVFGAIALVLGIVGRFTRA
jgi:hypothetical protein